MKNSFGVITICSLALLVTGCASKPLEPRNITTINEPHALEWVEVDYAPADNASLAMTKMQKLGVDFAINDALNAEDTYTYYSRGSRAGSALISAAGMGLMSGIADLSITGRANERTSEYGPHAGFYVDKSEYEGLTAEEQFQVAINHIGLAMFDAASKELDDAEFIGVYNSALTEHTAMLAFDSAHCSNERREQFGYRTTLIRGFAIQERDDDFDVQCFIPFKVTGLEVAGEQILRAEFLEGEYALAPILRNLGNAFVVMPYQYRAGSRRVTVQNTVPYVAWEGKANLFTRDSATINIL